MKVIFFGLLITTLLNANIEINQNIKALYRGVKLTEVEKNYILDNQQENINRLIETSKQFKHKNLNEKNVIEFILHPNGLKSNYIFLTRSDERDIDKETKMIINNTLLIHPSQDVKMRYIFHYSFEQANKIQYVQNNVPQSSQSKVQTPDYQNIERGTTRFEYSTKEYVRVFKTSQDGFINAKNSMCANMQLLTIKNQRISTGAAPWYFNTAIPKGTYKLLVQTKKDCDVNIQYP